ncbi:hypothetical protein [Nesterenkonia suensis]
MPENTPRRAGAKELEVLQALRKNGAVNFERIGEMVKDMPDTVLDPDVVSGDYIATGYSSVIHVWKTGIEQLGLDEAADVRDLSDRLRRPGR